MMVIPNAHSRRHDNRGMTLVEVVALLFTLVAIAIFITPVLRPTRAPATRIKCVTNLKQISLGARMWASDNGDKFPWETRNAPTNELGAPDLVAIYRLMSNELMSPKILRCPADPTRASATSFAGLNLTNLSYFANTSSKESRPIDLQFGDRNVLLAGVRARSGQWVVTNPSQLTWDRDLHKRAGNIALADGSVFQTSLDVLPALYRTNQPATNLLVFP